MMLTLKRHRAILTALLLVAGTVFLAGWYVQNRQAVMMEALSHELTTAEAELRTRAALSYQSELADPLTRIVRDCPHSLRQQFDGVLNELNTLTPAEITAAEPLFAACADFFAKEKAAAVWHLREQYALVETLVATYIVINPLADRQIQTTDWERFIAQQSALADLLEKQAGLQHEIVALLATGKAPGAPEVQQLVRQNRELTETAAVTNEQAAATYAALRLP
jgi:hypothetical protein